MIDINTLKLFVVRIRYWLKTEFRLFDWFETKLTFYLVGLSLKVALDQKDLDVYKLFKIIILQVMSLGIPYEGNPRNALQTKFVFLLSLQ